MLEESENSAENEENQQMMADIIFTFLVREAPQGIKDIDAVVRNCRPDIIKSIPNAPKDALIEDLARRLATPIEGYTRDQRLFAVELQDEVTTQLRDQIVL